MRDNACYGATFDLFHLQHSSNVTPLPPKMSRALPIVRSIFPRLRLSTSSRSAMFRPPPAYVTGIEHICDKYVTSCVSMPACLPSTSAAWIKNSLQHGSSRAMLSDSYQQGLNYAMMSSPWLISKSVIVCHLSIATLQPPSTLLQLRSITSFDVSPSSSNSTDSSRSWENVPAGKRKDVMMTYHTSAC